jgi:tetratricopeptide (TPR) repeat protein
VAALGVAMLAARAEAATDQRELKAREDFVAGRYQDALDLFAKLYAETLHPNYLRNIGRCYQNLGEPDRAISSFHDYLRKAKGVTSDERKEIEGYIKEMEELKRQREAAATSPATPPPTGSAGAPVTPLPSASPPPAAANVSVIVQAPQAPPPVEESSPIYSRWWFWAIVAGAAAAGLGVAAAAGVFTSTKDASCPTGVSCSP